MSLNPYLTFDGNCREAFDFYRSVFGTEFRVLSTFAEAPDDMEVPDADKDNVMHASLPIGSSVLMGSDSPAGPPVVVGNNFSISPRHRGSGRERQAHRQAVRRRRCHHANAGHVLGILFRDMHRQVRHQLDDFLRPVGVGQR